MRGLMIQGTSSDAGKSVLTTAFCRIFHHLGYRVAPFKSQNMSNICYRFPDGREMSRAQAIQAEAACIAPNVYMNPILLKPTGNMHSDVILFGEKVTHLSGKEYRQQLYEMGLQAIRTSLEHLQNEYELLVIEGAGSPVEINLNDRELVNMKVAELAEVPVFLVADIERGGVFASIVGTLELLNESERARVRGIIINKLRGDLSLFDSGVQFIEERTGKKVVGVIPYFEQIDIDAEDSLSEKANSQRDSRVNSTYDRYDALAAHVEKYIDLQYVIDVVKGWESRCSND